MVATELLRNISSPKLGESIHNRNEMVGLLGKASFKDLSKAFFKLAGSVVLQSHIREYMAPSDPASFQAWASSFLIFTHSTLLPFYVGLLKLPSLHPLRIAEQSLNGNFGVSHEDATYFSSVNFLDTAVQATSHFASSLYKSEWIQRANWWRGWAKYVKGIKRYNLPVIK